jgi:tRNA1Val (adenine37-N6)-methyltransferase
LKIQAPDCLTPSPDESLDRLTESWRIFQLRKGHRFSTDDLLTAWMAWRFNPEATDCLDLGTGIGTVGLLTLHKMRPSARLTAVEVQEISYSLARRTVNLNALQNRVELVLGDLRSAKVLSSGRLWDQITGSPPYFPVGTAVISPHPQRAGARMELKGDVFDYCAAAARVLAEGGFFTFVHAAGDPRPEQAIQASGLQLRCRRNVRFRADRSPTIALFVCAWGGDRQDEPDFVIRDKKGALTAENRSMRVEMGGP